MLKSLVLLLLTGIIALTGCSMKSTSESFMRDDVDLSFISQIAVVPFENNSQDEYVAARTRDITITQVLALGLFDVVDKGVVDSVLLEEGIDKSSPIDSSTLKRLGQRLNVQAFLYGAIDYAGEGRKGSVTYPEITLTLRLVEVGTGMIIWQASGHRSGDSVTGRLFGLAPDDNYRVTLKLVRQLLYSISAGEQGISAPDSVDEPEVPDELLDKEPVIELDPQES